MSLEKLEARDRAMSGAGCGPQRDDTAIPQNGESPIRGIIPQDRETRKRTPITTGVLDYFPAALAAVAEVSLRGNEQHNPGEPLHWARNKSLDHADCIARHLIERGGIGPDGVRHSAALAWRALALLQEEMEREGAEIPQTPRQPDRPEAAFRADYAEKAAAARRERDAEEIALDEHRRNMEPLRGGKWSEEDIARMSKNRAGIVNSVLGVDEASGEDSGAAVLGRYAGGTLFINQIVSLAPRQSGKSHTVTNLLQQEIATAHFMQLHGLRRVDLNVGIRNLAKRCVTRPDWCRPAMGEYIVLVELLNGSWATARANSLEHAYLRDVGEGYPLAQAFAKAWEKYVSDEVRS